MPAVVVALEQRSVVSGDVQASVVRDVECRLNSYGSSVAGNNTGDEVNLRWLDATFDGQSDLSTIDRAARVSVAQAQAELARAGFDVAAERAKAESLLAWLDDAGPKRRW